MKLRDIITEVKKETDPTKHLEKFVDSKNWPKDLAAAKEFGKEATAQFKFKDKIEKFNNEIDKATTVAKVQSVVINAIMAGEGNKVI